MLNGLFPAAGGLTGCMLITHFPAKAERQRRPDLEGRPSMLLVLRLVAAR